MDRAAKLDKYAVRLWLIGRRASGLPLPDFDTIIRDLRAATMQIVDEDRIWIEQLQQADQAQNKHETLFLDGDFQTAVPGY